jgi:hypothetical protein
MIDKTLCGIVAGSAGDCVINRKAFVVEQLLAKGRKLRRGSAARRHG